MKEREESAIETEIKKQMEQQFRRGMYTAALGISGAIKGMIADFERKPKKKLVDYQKTLMDIKSLCNTKLNNPDKQEENV